MGCKGDLARQYFLSGANCTQAVFAAFHQECGLDEKTAFRMASGFGAGVARLREVCGAVSGMVLVMNMLAGPDDISDTKAKDAHYARVRKPLERFRSLNGSIVCRVLLGLEKGENASAVSEERTAEYYKKRPCADLVAMAADIVAEELELS